VTDAHETFGEHVQQEAAQELIERKRQQLLFVVVSGIAPTKGDLPVGEGDQAMVGNGHAMGVTAQILEYKLWATEGWFQIDDPVLSVQGSQPGGKDFPLSEEFEISLEAQLAVTESLLECSDELAAKDFPQHWFGKKVTL